MSLKGVSAFIKSRPKTHVIKLYQQQGEFYFKALVPRDKQLQVDWKQAGKIPPNETYRDGFGIGRCVATRMSKTATLLVELPGVRRFDVRDPTCTKKQRYTKKVQIHDEYEMVNPGDVIMFKKLPHPKSKLKYYGLHEILKRAPQWSEYPSWEGTTNGDFHNAHPDDQDRDENFDLHYRLLRRVESEKRKMKEQNRENMITNLEKKEKSRGNWMKAQKSFGLWCDEKGILKTNETYERYKKDLGDDIHHIPDFPTRDASIPAWREKHPGAYQKVGKSKSKK